MYLAPGGAIAGSGELLLFHSLHIFCSVVDTVVDNFPQSNRPSMMKQMTVLL